jgi:type IV secretory pathway TraG/TraD family ATPase VirD4
MPFEQLLVNALNAFRRKRATRQPSATGLLVGTTNLPDGSRQSIILPDARRTEHVYVLGKTGVGKTHFLEVMAEQCLQRGDGFAFLDVHGDASLRLIEMASRFPQAADRLVVVDPTDPDVSPGVNPLENVSGDDHESFVRASDVASILRRRWNEDSFTPRIEETLRAALVTLSVNGLTLVELPRLLSNRDFRHHAVGRVTNEDVRSYWRERFEPLSEPMKSVLLAPLSNRLSAFIGVPWVRHFIGQAHSTINFADAMRKRQWLIVRLTKGVLREHSLTLANLILSTLTFEVLARVRQSKSNRATFTVICDEVQNFNEADLILLLAEGRKFGISILCAHQFRGTTVAVIAVGRSFRQEHRSCFV